MARAKGCSEYRSALAATRSNRSRPTPGEGSMDTTSGFPSVSVPVLSRTTVSTLLRVSMYNPPFTMVPCLAARPMAPRMASGVPAAMPHAPATITTEIVERALCVRMNVKAAQVRAK
jgi:hypothetical protein